MQGTLFILGVSELFNSGHLQQVYSEGKQRVDCEERVGGREGEDGLGEGRTGGVIGNHLERRINQLTNC